MKNKGPLSQYAVKYQYSTCGTTTSLNQGAALQSLQSQQQQSALEQFIQAQSQHLNQQRQQRQAQSMLDRLGSSINSDGSLKEENWMDQTSWTNPVGTNFVLDAIVRRLRSGVILHVDSKFPIDLEELQTFGLGGSSANVTVVYLENSRSSADEVSVLGKRIEMLPSRTLTRTSAHHEIIGICKEVLLLPSKIVVTDDSPNGLLSSHQLFSAILRLR